VRGRCSVRKLGSAVTLVMVTSACGDPAGVPVTVGYDLILLDGVPLPVELGPSYAIVAGSLDLTLDGTCRRTVRVRAPAGPEISDQLESEMSWGCTWTRAGSSLSFTWTDDVGIPLLPSPGTVASSWIHEGHLTLVFETGIVCVRAPCPSTWTEVYERMDDS
jgi:hypothetical protein